MLAIDLAVPGQCREVLCHGVAAMATFLFHFLESAATSHECLRIIARTCNTLCCVSVEIQLCLLNESLLPDLSLLRKQEGKLTPLISLGIIS